MDKQNIDNKINVEFDKLHLVWISDMALNDLLHGATWLNTTQELRSLGWKVTLISPGFSGSKKIRGIDVFGIERPEKMLLRHIVYQYKIIQLIRSMEEPPHVILFNELPAFSLLIYRALRKWRKRSRPVFVMDTRSLLMPPEDKLLFKDHLRRSYFSAINWFANRFADGRTAITSRMADVLNIPQNKSLGVWPSGVDLKLFADKPDWYESDLQGKTIRLIYIGSMHYERNLMALSKAVFQASKLGMDFELVLIGDGEEFNDLKDYSEGKTDVIKVYTPVPHTEIPIWLKNAHIGVLPFPDEIKFQVSSPIKLFEYMAAGLPIMATRIFCHTNVIQEGKYVFWIDGDKKEDILETLRIIWQRREELTKMGQLAFASAENWTWRNSAKKLNDALLNALEIIS